MSRRTNWPPGLDPSKDTTNGIYGAYVPGNHLWERSYLQYYPTNTKNRKLDRFRQKLVTSSEEYGYYWANAASPQGTPFHLTRKERSFNHPNIQSNSNMLKIPERSQSEPVSQKTDAEQKADEFWEKIKPSDDYLDQNNNWGAVPLPPIRDVERAFVPKFTDGEVKVDGKTIKLPDIKQITIQLHMADSSIINLKTIPYRPYQFHH